MAEILPDGTMQGYYNICKNCGKEIEVNMQGTAINHRCKVKNLDIPHVINPVCGACGNPSYTKALFTGRYICQRCGEPWPQTGL